MEQANSLTEGKVGGHEQPMQKTQSRRFLLESR
jgi:hypothetical protein